ncbi:MAG: Wzz/FepE/Etk N-terminal domain-containing protein [Gammaproteobacteria bacterium]|nr:MAG: Wzz/FepE/Etk N-terminal domain-containing protein [Gammaproteobacteria bacterium]
MKRANEHTSGSGHPQTDEQLPRVGQRPVLAEYPGQATEEDEISLVDVWRVLDKYKGVIFAAIAFCTLAFVLAALVMTPVYRTQVLVAPVSESDNSSRFPSQLGEFGSIAALAGVNLERGSRKNEAIATLKSRIFTEQFIKEEKLLPVLFHKNWNKDKQRWNVTDTADTPTLGDGWELFNKKVRKVYEDRKTGLVVLSIEWEDPREAARWANELVRRVNAMLRKKAVAESENAIGYLREQLRQTSVVELQQVVNQLIESEMKEIILANITEEYAFRTIDPAVAPDEAFKPVMVLMVVLGIVSGIVLGIILALTFSFVRAQRERDIYQSN